MTALFPEPCEWAVPVYLHLRSACFYFGNKLF